MKFLNQLPKDKVKVKVKFDGNDTYFTDEDNNFYKNALLEQENKTTMSLEELKKKIC